MGDRITECENFILSNPQEGDRILSDDALEIPNARLQACHEAPRRTLTQDHYQQEALRLYREKFLPRALEKIRENNQARREFEEWKMEKLASMKEVIDSSIDSTASLMEKGAGRLEQGFREVKQVSDEVTAQAESMSHETYESFSPEGQGVIDSLGEFFGMKKNNLGDGLSFNAESPST